MEQKAPVKSLDTLISEFKSGVERLIKSHAESSGPTNDGNQSNELLIAATMARDILSELHRLARKNAMLDMDMAVRIQTCMIMLEKAIGKQPS